MQTNMPVHGSGQFGKANAAVMVLAALAIVVVVAIALMPTGSAGVSTSDTTASSSSTGSSFRAEERARLDAYLSSVQPYTPSTDSLEGLVTAESAIALFGDPDAVELSAAHAGSPQPKSLLHSADGSIVAAAPDIVNAELASFERYRAEHAATEATTQLHRNPELSTVERYRVQQFADQEADMLHRNPELKSYYGFQQHGAMETAERDRMWIWETFNK